MARVDLEALYGPHGIAYLLEVTGLPHYSAAFAAEGLVSVREIEGLLPEELQRLVPAVGERRRLLNVLAPNCTVSGPAVAPFVLQNAASPQRRSRSPRQYGPPPSQAGYSKYDNLTFVPRGRGRPCSQTRPHAVSASWAKPVRRTMSYFVDGIRGAGTEYTTEVPGMAREVGKACPVRPDLQAFGRSPERIEGGGSPVRTSPRRRKKTRMRSASSPSDSGTYAGMSTASSVGSCYSPKSGTHGSPGGYSYNSARRKRAAADGSAAGGGDGTPGARLYNHPAIPDPPSDTPPLPSDPSHDPVTLAMSVERRRPKFIARGESILEFFTSARVNMPSARAAKLERELGVRGMLSLPQLRDNADVLEKCRVEEDDLAAIKAGLRAL